MSKEGYRSDPCSPCQLGPAVCLESFFCMPCVFAYLSGAIADKNAYNMHTHAHESESILSRHHSPGIVKRGQKEEERNLRIEHRYAVERIPRFDIPCFIISLVGMSACPLGACAGDVRLRHDFEEAYHITTENADYSDLSYLCAWKKLWDCCASTVCEETKKEWEKDTAKDIKMQHCILMNICTGFSCYLIQILTLSPFTATCSLVQLQQELRLRNRWSGTWCQRGTPVPILTPESAKSSHEGIPSRWAGARWVYLAEKKGKSAFRKCFDLWVCREKTIQYLPQVTYPYSRYPEGEEGEEAKTRPIIETPKLKFMH